MKILNSIIAAATALCAVLFMMSGCGNASHSDNTEAGADTGTVVTLSFSRVKTVTPYPFTVTVSAVENGAHIEGSVPEIEVPEGTVSDISYNSDGDAVFTVTPDKTGIYPVTVSVNGTSVKREVLVVSQMADGFGQPLLVPGLVNTDGYEDGITITPDGRYLFIQYGPVYFSGVFLHREICAETGWSMYDLKSCPAKPDNGWVFNTIGPYSAPERPEFPTGAIDDGKLTHLDITVAGVANGIVLFPTVFYGFKRLDDGSFGKPFKVAFNDSKGTNSPFGLSFMMTGEKEAVFVVAWDNYFNHLGDDYGDIYCGSMTMEQETSLGDVVYEGEGFKSITPKISPVGFSSHSGVQGNPHLYYDSTGTVRSIWTDDEQVSHDLSVYVLVSGSFPDGTWNQETLPSKINTPSSESQPFFTGKRLYLNRETTIVYHELLGTSESDYADNASWGDETVVVKAGEVGIGRIFGVGEPTLAQFDGKTYLYLVYVQIRGEGETAGRYDFDMGAAFVPVGE